MEHKTYKNVKNDSDIAKEPAAVTQTVFNSSQKVKAKLTSTGLMADNGYGYPSEDELQNIFASSCVETVAKKLHLSTGEAYKRMKRAELFRDLIYPCYAALHTQSREVVTDDIIQALQIREAKLKEEES